MKIVRLVRLMKQIFLLQIDRPTFLFVGIAVLSTYLIVIVGFFCANKSGRQSYGRLQHA